MTIIKKYNAESSQWEKVAVGPSAEWDHNQSIKTVNSSSNLTSSDAGLLLIVDSNSEVILTVNEFTGFAIGQRVDFLRAGEGEVSVVGVDVVVNAEPGFKLKDQWSVALLLCLDENVYTLMGGLDA
jgi:hypothetical protein